MSYVNWITEVGMDSRQRHYNWGATAAVSLALTSGFVFWI